MKKLFSYLSSIKCNKIENNFMDNNSYDNYFGTTEWLHFNYPSSHDFNEVLLLLGYR